MALVNQIQIFLKDKLKTNNLKRKSFAQESNILYQTVCNIINSARANPELETILKIANYFKCSMDEVIGKNKNFFINQKDCNFQIINSEDINTNLKCFLNKKLKEQNINPYQLGITIGFGQDVIPKFLKESNPKKMFTSTVAVALSDYFQVSLDEMIGRVKPTTTVNSSDENSDKDIDLNNL
ncbi:helix-turn-helix domain-containing protein [Rickettsia endosymbiont of Culicoides newsteadi]|uniref:helix-turn-helix domain-containing protein n=1 Tax=Rickettsia endosymbiont of Culicoides newsteadi TaxID=1961830 RepID=UPI000B9C0606|nr:helix-turn-helix domain-containing protein [Rickettsia endosymbiont of Culicoides newsteadi]OZG32412.1 transcriptional regulator [Rickettsia endosymbiont of Culicoides newsteadi]